MLFIVSESTCKSSCFPFSASVSGIYEFLSRYTSCGTLGGLPLSLIQVGEGGDIHGQGIGAIVYVGVVSKGREARGVAALEVGVAAREAVVIFVDGVEGELVGRKR